MIFLVGIILVAISVGIAILFGSKNWEPDNLADKIGKAFFYSGLGLVALSILIVLVRALP